MHAVHDVVALRETFVVVGAAARATRPAVHAATAGEVGFGHDRELHARQHHAAVERRDHDVHAGRLQGRARLGDRGDAVDGHTLADEQLLDAVGRSAALGRDEHAVTRRCAAA